MGSDGGRQRPRRIVVNGPLAVFADGLRRELVGQGYALDTVRDHVHLLADLSDWLGSQDLTAQDLTRQRVEAFLRHRRGSGCRIGLSSRAVAPILRYLRDLRVAPPLIPSVPVTAEETLLASYRNYLMGERGVSDGTIRHYLRCARVFLGSLAGQLDVVLAELSAAQVTGYVLAWAKSRQGKAVDLVTLVGAEIFIRAVSADFHAASSAPG
jgi:integrase/recombinase XerD